MWYFHRMSFYVETLDQFNNFFGRVCNQEACADNLADVVEFLRSVLLEITAPYTRANKRSLMTGTQCYD